MEIYRAKTLSEVELDDWPNVFGKGCGLSYAGGYVATQQVVDAHNPYLVRVIDPGGKPKDKSADIRRLKKADYHAKFDKLGVPLEDVEHLNRWEKATKLGECADKEVIRANKYGSHYDPSIAMYARRKQWKTGCKRPPIWDRVQPLMDNMWKFIEGNINVLQGKDQGSLHPLFSGKPHSQWKPDEEDQMYEARKYETIVKEEDNRKLAQADTMSMFSTHKIKYKKQKVLKVTKTRYESDGKMIHVVEYVRHPMMIEACMLDQKFKHQRGFRFISSHWTQNTSTVGLAEHDDM
jgi:hypothetical protein